MVPVVQSLRDLDWSSSEHRLRGIKYVLLTFIDSITATFLITYPSKERFGLHSWNQWRVQPTVSCQTCAESPFVPFICIWSAPLTILRANSFWMLLNSSCTAVADTATISSSRYTHGLAWMVMAILEHLPYILERLSITRRLSDRVFYFYLAQNYSISLLPLVTGIL